MNFHFSDEIYHDYVLPSHFDMHVEMMEVAEEVVYVVYSFDYNVLDVVHYRAMLYLI